MSFEVLERSTPPANRRNEARHSGKKVMLEWRDAVFSSPFKDALIVTQQSIFLTASAREA